MSDAVTTLWVESLQSSYSLAYGERMNDLHGVYVRRYDDQGLHPFSTAWGAVKACEALCPELNVEGVATSAHALRKAAHADADRAFREEIVGQLTLEEAA